MIIFYLSNILSFILKSKLKFGMDILSYSASLILLINFLIFIKYFDSNNKSFKIFTLYCGTMVFTQFASVITGKMGQNNVWVSHTYYIVQFLTLSWFFYSLVQTKLQKLIIKFFLFIVSTSLLYMYLYHLIEFDKHNLYQTFVTSFTLIIYATFYLYNLLNKRKEFYFITIGILFYLIGSTVIWLGYDLFTSFQETKFATLLSIINVIMYIIYQLLVFVELQKNYLKNTK